MLMPNSAATAMPALGRASTIAGLLPQASRAGAVDEGFGLTEPSAGVLYQARCLPLEIISPSDGLTGRWVARLAAKAGA
jgi:hypothetical protein